LIVAAAAQDWRIFMTLAEGEGWRVPKNELSLHRQGGCSRAWALRDDDATIGLITGVRHQQSAWIGNLIIAPAARGRGFGAQLFDHAVKELRAAGATTLWLTASAQGAPLYAQRGFQTVAEIQRWVLREGGIGAGGLLDAGVKGSHSDVAVWGDDRRPLLHHLEGGGNWQQQGESLALLQRGEDLQIIGPWYGSTRLQDDAELLDRLIAAATPQQELVVDLVSLCGRGRLLAAAGFTCAGNTGLMVAGPAEVDWPRLVALATLGSCG
jgi:GNAT superfamily N-acetyltransferase